MTTHPQKKGLSNRAYARSRGGTEAAVRQARDDGRLKEAILPDGSIDPEKADALLSRAATSGKNAPADLSEARRRKLAAQCALLHDEIADMAGAVVLPDDASRIMTESCVVVARRLFRIPREAARMVAGKAVMEASGILQDATYQALEDLSKTPAQPAKGGEPRRLDQSLDEMDRTELAALKATYQTHKIHIQRDRKKGVVLDIADISASMINRFAALRAKVLSLHVKAAPYVTLATAAEAEELLHKEVTDIVGDLADGKMVALDALIDTRPVDQQQLRQS